jgi:outer membrane protein
MASAEISLPLTHKTPFMQRVLLVLNILLLIAVAYLFVDKFSSGRGASGAEESAVDKTNDESGLQVVYVNVDTLLNNYDAFRNQQKALTAREQEEDAKLRSRGKALEREIMALQEKAAGGTMTPRDLKMEEERLMRKQQEFLADQERISRDLLAESGRVNEELQGRIVRIIKDVKEERGYDIVLSYGVGSPVLAIDSTMDITPVVLKRLNAAAR